MSPDTRRIRPALLREMNERAIFELLRTSGPATRAQLARQLGMSAPAASRAAANLLQSGLIEMADSPSTSSANAGAGRPGQWYRLSASSRIVLGATIGLKQCSVVAAGLDGQYTESSVIAFRTPATYARLIDAFADAVRKSLRGHKGDPLGLGLGLPGQIDRQTQTVLMSPNLHILDGQSPERDLQKRLGIRTVMFHETDCACLAEHSFGAGRGLSDFALISIYEGLGASAVSAGRLVTGYNGLAGEIGHCTVDLHGKPCGCGNRGCLETVATDSALAEAVSKRLRRPLDIDDVVRLARSGVNVPELDQTLEYLAIGIGIMVNALNPQAVLLCGRLFDAADDSLERLRRHALRHALGPLLRNCQIVRAQGSTRKGAIASILQHVTNTLGPAIA